MPMRLHMELQMKNLLLCILALGLVTGCASLHSQIHKEVHQGDSQDHVEQALGEPDSFRQSQKDSTVTVWNYQKKSDFCSIAFREQKVIQTACQTDPNYVGPIGKMLQGGAQGMQSGLQQQQNRSVSCTTNQVGSTAYTNCY